MTQPTKPAHLDDCCGNGWGDCWNCEGGKITVPDDDMTERQEDCEVCGGTGIIDCPACPRGEEA